MQHGNGWQVRPEDEAELCLLGMVAMQDPPWPKVAVIIPAQALPDPKDPEWHMNQGTCCD